MVAQLKILAASISETKHTELFSLQVCNETFAIVAWRYITSLSAELSKPLVSRNP
jgi:hypothetical protein